MAVLTADFSGGTNGSTLSTGDTGHATAYDAVTITSPATLTYDNTHTSHSVEAAEIVTTAASKRAFIGWAAALGTVTDFYGRAYFYITGNPSSFQGLIQAYSATGYATSAGTIFLNSTGHIHCASAAAGLSPDFTNAVTANQWVRIEYHLTNSATVGVLEVKLFNTADSTTATETQTYTALNTAASTKSIGYGQPDAANSVAFTYWMAGVVANASAYPGPFPVNTTAPTISGSAPVGSVLTAGNGSWNTSGTFNYTYQWTSGGTNIGGATASTYTTVSGDAGNAIGCKVTATGQQATNESATQASSNTITPTSIGAVNQGLLALLGVG